MSTVLAAAGAAAVVIGTISLAIAIVRGLMWLCIDYLSEEEAK